MPANLFAYLRKADASGKKRIAVAHIPDTGLGIGLYHSALQAAELGYVVRLAENRPGCVRFELRQASASNSG